MKYILEYIKEEMFIEPVAGSTIDLEEEYSDATTPIGYRLIINGKDVDIVVWHADYSKWLERKYDNLDFELRRRVDARTVKDLMTDKEQEHYEQFCNKHRGCEFTSTIGGKISVEVTGTGLGYCFKCKCNACGEEENITDINSW